MWWDLFSGCGSGSGCESEWTAGMKVRMWEWRVTVCVGVSVERGCESGNGSEG